jgi:hypothetical protein
MPMRHPALLTWLTALPATAALALALAPAAQAGSITAESIWDKKNAIQRAQEQLPANATVTTTRCTVVTVRNWRYICTLDYTTTPAAPASSQSSAPAP